VSAGAVAELLAVLKSAAATCSNQRSSGAQPLSPDASAIRQHAAVVLGSLALTPEGLTELVQRGGLAQLVALLSDPDAAVAEAGLRALKLAMQQVNLSA
jgi:hypothetical protein